MSTLSITGIQANLHWKDKAANLKMFGEKIDSIEGRAEIVILPEMFSTGFVMQPKGLAEPMNGPTIEWMRKKSESKKIIIAGSVIIEEEGRYYNRLVMVLPDGQFGYYDKRHRFAFAGEDQNYSAGKKRLIASIKGWKINCQICYDLRFPVWARQTVSYLPQNEEEPQLGDKAPPEYDLLIYVANWPERRILAWEALLQARAIENQCYVAGVNRVGNDGENIYHSGRSTIVDPLGEILYKAGEKEELFTCVLRKDRLEDIRTKFPFWKDSDDFKIKI